MFHPRGIAVVGASGDLTRTGGQAVHALNEYGYKGGVYPVNPKYPELAGRRCYPSLAAIDGICDLAVVALPAAQVPTIIAQCGERGSWVPSSISNGAVSHRSMYSRIQSSLMWVRTAFIKQPVIDLIEGRLDVKLDHPVILPAPVSGDRPPLVCRPSRPVSIGVRMEHRVETSAR